MHIKELLKILDEHELKKSRTNREGIRKRVTPCFAILEPFDDIIRDVIISKNVEEIIPGRWDELMWDRYRLYVKYCKTCDKDVYLVTNECRFNELMEEHDDPIFCVPINTSLFRKIYPEYKQQIDQYIFIQSIRQLKNWADYLQHEIIYACDMYRAIELLQSGLTLESYSYSNPPYCTFYSFYNYSDLVEKNKNQNIDIDDIFLRMIKQYNCEIFLPLKKIL